MIIFYSTFFIAGKGDNAVKRPLFFVCLCAVAVIAVLGLFGTFTHPFKSEEISASGHGTVYVSCTVSRRDSKYYYLKKLHFYDEGSHLLSGPGKKATILVGREDLTCFLPVGSKVCLHGKFSAFKHATNPGEFDMSDYYSELGTIGRLSDPVIDTGPFGINVFSEGLAAARESFEKRLYTIFPGREASVLSDLLLGERAGLDEGIKKLYTRSGIAHILSISALHVSIIGMGLYGLLRRLRVPTPAAALIGASVLIIYGIMTGMSISAMRAIGMYILKLGADVSGRTPDRATSLLSVCAVLAFIYPARLLSCGFLLSFGAVAGISFVAPAISSYACGLIKYLRPEAPAEHKGFAAVHFQKAKRALFASLNASFSASLTTLPIVLWYFFEVPVYGIFLNIIILPFMSLLMISALIAMLIPGAGILGTPAYFILKGFEALCRLIDSLPGGMWNPGRPKMWAVILYYAILMLFVLISDEKRRNRMFRAISPLWVRKKPCVRCSQSKGQMRSISHASVLLSPFLMAFMMIFFMALPRLPKNSLIMLDVGQGDGLIYYTDAREVYLFDGGSSSNKTLGQYVLKPALKYYGFSHIDAAFVSHPDTDHLSGLMDILENRDDWGFKVDEVVLPGCVAEDLRPAEDSFDNFDLHNSGIDVSDGGLHNFEKLVRLASSEYGKRRVVISYMCTGDEWKSGRNRFICLHPTESFSAEEPNEMSECILIDFYGDMSATLLLTGDVQGAGEEALTAGLQKIMAGKPLTILKVAHHGSKYSTPADFLKVASPRLALISAGRNNRYGHPHKEVISRLGDAGCVILSTKESGAVILYISRAKIAVRISSCRN